MAFFVGSLNLVLVTGQHAAKSLYGSINVLPADIQMRDRADVLSHTSNANALFPKFGEQSLIADLSMSRFEEDHIGFRCFVGYLYPIRLQQFPS